MHPTLKRAKQRFPAMENLFINLNNAIREGHRTKFTASDLLMLAQWNAPQDHVSLYELAEAIAAIEQSGAMSSELQVRDLSSGELLATYERISDVETTIDGKTIIPDGVDYTELDTDPTHFATLSEVYTFEGLYDE